VTASSQEKIDFCKSIGATEGFSYKDGDWAQALLKYTEGRGVDLIVDFVGGSYFNQNLKTAAQDGRIVNLGFLGGNIVKGEVDLAQFLMKRVRFEGSNLRLQSISYQERLRDLLVEKALDKFIDGSFKVILEKVFRMDEIRDAHELLESSQTKGKIICTVE
jgi:NADPH:quinone reductase-like Zn-dependent oxidoreductase